MRLRKPKDMVKLFTMDKEPVNIHQRIKYKRMRAGLSQAKLAMRIGVKRATVSQWELEREGATVPTGQNLMKCADALETTPEYLLYGIESKNDTPIQNIPGTIQLEYKLLPVLHDNDIIDLSQTGQFKNNYERTFMVMNHHLKTTKGMFGYEIVSDAMVHPTNRELSLFIGETAIFDKDLPPKSGDIVLAVLQSNDVKPRQLIVDGVALYLKAYNPDYAQAKMDPKTDKIAGTFVGIQPKMRLIKSDRS